MIKTTNTSADSSVPDAVAPRENESVADSASSKDALAGLLIFGMVLFVISGDIIGGSLKEPFILVSGLCAWGAAAFLFRRVRRSQQVLFGVLVLVGFGLLFLVWQQSGRVALAEAISRNTGLITMIVSVGFLKLIVASSLKLDSTLPMGKKAFRDTLMSVAVFGAFINISALAIISDRLSQNRPLTFFAGQTLTRTFSGCSAWSPFFAGMAVVLTYILDVRIEAVIFGALPFAIVGFIVIYLLGVIFHKESVENFRGFPMQISSLWIPAVLALLVVFMIYWMPRLSILTVIALGGILVTVTVLAIRERPVKAAKALGFFVVDGMPRSANELLLFLAAGVMASGLVAVVDQGWLNLSLTSFDAMTACLLLGAMVLIAMCGIHPVILISAITPLLAPVSPDPELLAVTYMFAWSLGTCASPLSGTHLMMQGRYGIPCWKAALHNWPFVAIMYVVAIASLLIIARVNGVAIGV